MILWLGGQDREYSRPEDMIDPLAPYADLTPDTIGVLRADRIATLDKGPTLLQRFRF